MDLIKFKEFALLGKAELNIKGSVKARQLMEDGYHDASVLTVQARKTLEYLTAFVKELDSDTRGEIKSEGLEIFGAVLSLSSTGDRLDYNQDTEYSRLKEALAERTKWLRIASYSKDEVVVDGAVVEGVPIKTASKEILKIRL